MIEYEEFINSKSRTFENIGSTNYVALKMIGSYTERIKLLKESYYNLALENMDKADLDYIIEGKTDKF